MKLFASAIFSLILPITTVVLIPYFIISNYDIHLLTINSLFAGIMLIAGSMLIILGLYFVIYTNKSFLKIGKGTLAPWDPPKKLVVAKLYRYVRNPMISGILMILLGESLIFASIELFLWFATFFIVNHLYIVYSEEPELIKRFGDDYVEYRNNVPRWIPRLSPWEKINLEKKR